MTARVAGFDHGFRPTYWLSQLPTELQTLRTEISTQTAIDSAVFAMPAFPRCLGNWNDDGIFIPLSKKVVDDCMTLTLKVW